MEINLESLIPYEKLKIDVDQVFQVVEKNGKVVLFKDNQPVYIIVKYDSNMHFLEKAMKMESTKYTLQEVMKIVLLESGDRTMRTAVLADKIYNRRLYLKKDGTKAEYNQIRAGCGHYSDLFEAMPGNVIKLKEGVK